jgi:predicted nuclease of restriction endonuclease-like RecB superfamily
VRTKTVSFEKLQRDKRRARLRDERRLARGEVTAWELERENSLIPPNARITIPDFCQTLERYYGK